MNSPDLIYIFLNGQFTPPLDLPAYPSDSTIVVAVDGGAVHCQKIGWPIHYLIGDLDSLTKLALKRIKKDNPNLETMTFPPEKDQTDFELALDFLVTKFPNFGRIEVLGALGGRWDMTVSNLLLPFSDRFVRPIRQSRMLKGQTLSPPVVTFRDGQWEVLSLSGPGWAI
ncbi:MAG: thiamine diphosphokinase, partial [Deltaproteobacteria bacterium]|nr:thiamine diphosphokinase [Deltaproteobacteria bacterium]